MNRFISDLYSVAGHWATTACPVINDRLSYDMLSADEQRRCIRYAPRAVLPLADSLFMSKAFTGARYAGARQMVMIHAGYETFHIRSSLWYDRVQVFDINPGAVLQDKQRRLSLAEKAPRTNIVSLVCDSVTDCRRILAADPVYDKAKATFVYLAGLPRRLDRESFKHLLTELFKIIPPYSSIVFSGNGADYNRLENLLSDTGFLIYEYMTACQLHTEYLRDFEILNSCPFPLQDDVSFCVAVKKERR